jgi:hypothetical protein
VHGTEGCEVLQLSLLSQSGASASSSTRGLNSKVCALCIICYMYYTLPVITNLIRVLVFGYNLLVDLFIVGDSCQPHCSCA